jgi:protein-S-isoprenylcysteine O-methyltransferase Ste14
MIARPALRGRSMPVDRSTSHTHLARWAAGIAAVVAIAVSLAIFVVAFGVGGWDAIDDTWVGFIVVVSLLGGLVASLVASEFVKVIGAIGS